MVFCLDDFLQFICIMIIWYHCWYDCWRYFFCCTILFCCSADAVLFCSNCWINCLSYSLSSLLYKKIRKMVWFKRVDDLCFSDFMDITGNLLSLISKWKQWNMSCGWYLNHHIFLKPFLMNQNAILNTEQKCISIISEHVMTNNE